MKIVYFYEEETEKKFFSEKMSGNEIVYLKGTPQTNSDYKDDKADALCVFVNSKIGVEEMNRFPNLKFIATRSTGFDHIDLVEAKKKGIVVSNVPTYGDNTVAEFAMTLVLALARKICLACNNTKKGDFSQKELKGFDLKGKTIGVVGVGNIGKYLIKMAKGFSMNVIAFDVNKDETFAKEAGFEYVEFDDLLGRSDIISLHVPLNPHTKHLINKDNISKIKKGSYLINTARGEVVDTNALLSALNQGIIAGAGLDVFEGEVETFAKFKKLFGASELVKNNRLLIKHPNVIVTPHNAFNTKEAIERILVVTVENIKAFSDNKTINTVEAK